MKREVKLLLTLGFSEPIKNTNEIATNVAKGIWHHAMDVGLTSEDDDGYVTDIKVGEPDGRPRVHVNIAGLVPQFLSVEDQGFTDGPTEKQKTAMALVATGLLSIAHDMETDEKFRDWIESTPFFDHFNLSIDEVGRLIDHIIPEDE